MPIDTQEEYEHASAQLQRQTIERDALNETITGISTACAVWETQHPATEESEAPAQPGGA